MPGQEKIVMEYYQKNPSAAEGLRGTIYEDKIMNLIKSKLKINKKEISKEEAEKILKSAHDHEHTHEHETLDDKKTTLSKKKPKPVGKKPVKTKKVSKK